MVINLQDMMGYAIWNNGKIASEHEKTLIVLVDALITNGKYIAVDAFLVDAKTWEGQSGFPVLVEVTAERVELLGAYSGGT